jgi:cephalosporin-C deacetylase-like acetyl esterase
MRQDVTFLSEGLKCTGWLYLPDDLRSGERRPVIVLAHGFSAVKEMYLDAFNDPPAELGAPLTPDDNAWFGGASLPIVRKATG